MCVLWKKRLIIKIAWNISVSSAGITNNARRKKKDMKFKINNRTWSIEEKPQSEIKSIQNQRKANEEENIKSLSTRYYGITYCDIMQIYIDKDLPEERKKSTLIHELTHCYIDNYITHSEQEYSEEDVADIVSNSYDIIHEIVDKYFK